MSIVFNNKTMRQVHFFRVSDVLGNTCLWLAGGCAHLAVTSNNLTIGGHLGPMAGTVETRLFLLTAVTSLNI